VLVEECLYRSLHNVRVELSQYEFWQGRKTAERGDWRLSVAPNSRIKDLVELYKLKGSGFEVVQTTGPRQ